MATTSFMMLFAMLLGGGSDLLDYVPSQDYWQAKGVAVTADGLVKDLTPPKAAEDITKLLVDLGSSKTAVREAATAKIVAIGPGVLPQLKEAGKLDHPEIAHKARELYEQINRAQKATQVRRLMAIRTLGEMKAREAVPALQGLVDSDEPFVADYAKAALAAIDGKPYERQHADSSDDVWLLPDKTRMVWHLSFRGGKPIDLDAVIKSLPHAEAVPVGEKPKGPDVAGIRKEAVGEFIKVAERVGNIRLDGITVGVSGEMGPNQGSVVVVARGQYDAAAVAELVGGLKDVFKDSKGVGGTTVFGNEDQGLNVFFPSNDRAVLVGGPGGRDGGNVLPVEEMVAAVRKNAGGLKDSKDAAGMVKLIRSIDTKQPLWGAIEVTPTYRQAPFMEPFDTVSLVGKPAGGDKADKLDIRFDARGTDPDKVRAAVGMVNQGLDQARQEMKRADQHVPPEMKPMLAMAREVLDSLKCQADGKAANLTGTLPTNGPGMLISTFFMGFSARAEVAPPPAAVAPPPPPVRVERQALPDRPE